MPVGNTWAVNPLPDDTQPGSLGPNGKRLTSLTEFTPPCRNNTDPHPPPHKKIEGLCSGERPFHVSVVDILRVPANTPPGDCELSANIVHPFCIVFTGVSLCVVRRTWMAMGCGGDGGKGVGGKESDDGDSSFGSARSG